MITFRKIKEIGYIIPIKQKKTSQLGTWFDNIINDLFPPDIVYHKVNEDTGQSTVVPIEQVPPEYIVNPEVSYTPSWWNNLWSGYGQTQTTSLFNKNTMIMAGIALSYFFIMHVTKGVSKYDSIQSK